MFKPWLCGLVLLSPLALFAAPAVVTLAVDDTHAPYATAVDGQAAGLYVQLVQRAMQHLPDWELRLESMPWKRALVEAEQGRVDAVLPPYRHAERPWMAIYVGPLHVETIVLHCSAQSQLHAGLHWPGDFRGRRIGMIRGYFLTRTVQQAVEQGQVIKAEYRNGFDALAALQLGQVDCLADDRTNLETLRQQALADPVWAKRMPVQLEPPMLLSEEEAFVGISRKSLAARPELAEFAKALDTEIGELRRHGEIEKLMRGR